MKGLNKTSLAKYISLAFVFVYLGYYSDKLLSGYGNTLQVILGF
ncbi:hypothetical protein CLW00_10566 [Mongoliibacter ruber]|uniref:Uncharacterized protein n=1 Tax=Mongoliibacter ruber TaxID=1750599 RepID=A0A2T0WML1_9BACT|nr:hypothetical protein CLW00_10566 [Mongoliibacter ruber]